MLQWWTLGHNRNVIHAE